MGACNSKHTVSTYYDEFYPLRISTIDINLDESINTDKKINTLVDYFIKPYYGYQLDVLCVQGIRSHKILKKILVAFKTKIEQHNELNRANYKNAIHLEYSPDIELSVAETNMMYSTSETYRCSHYYDKLVISRHSILNQCFHPLDVSIPCGSTNYYGIDEDNGGDGMSANDSDDIYKTSKNIQVVNLNVGGTYVSVYNIELEPDNIGISNIKKRKLQLKTLNEIIKRNIINSKKDIARMFRYVDHDYITCNRNIHIVCGMFHINNYVYGEPNHEYNRMLGILNGIDIHQVIYSLKKQTGDVYTNTRFTKDSYMLLISPSVTPCNEIMKIFEKIFDEHKLVIRSSNVMKNHVDMNKFTNYPIDTTFLLYKPETKMCNVNPNTHMYKEHNKMSPAKKLNNNTNNANNTNIINGDTVMLYNQVATANKLKTIHTAKGVINNINNNVDCSSDDETNDKLIDVMNNKGIEHKHMYTNRVVNREKKLN